MPDTENSIQNEGLPEVTLQIVASPSQTASMTVAASNTVQAPVDATLTISGKAADAKVTGNRLSAVEANANAKVNKPTENPNGTAGQVLRTKGNGATEWASVGQPTDAQTKSAVSEWLTAHPEATTTVQDGAITGDKLSDRLIAELKNAVTITAGTNGPIISHLLIHQNAIDIYTQPASTEAQVGSTATFTIVAYASGTEIIDGEEIEAVYDVSYQWQSRERQDSGNWTNVGTNSDTLSVPVTENANQFYRCVVTCADTGDTKTSDIAYLIIYTEAEPIEEPIEDPEI